MYSNLKKAFSFVPKNLHVEIKHAETATFLHQQPIKPRRDAFYGGVALV